MQVASPRLPDQEQLISELHNRLRVVAQKQERQDGEPVELGDEVELDLVTVVEGHVLFTGVQRLVNFELRDWVHLPGLVDQVVGMPTWSAKTVEYQLPQDYPVETVAGRQATIFLSLRSAHKVEPFELDDSAILTAAGLRPTIEEAFAEIALELDAAQGDALLNTSTQAVLEALGQRVSEPIPTELVDLELDQSWQKTVGAILQENQFEADVLKASYQQFLSNPSLREEATNRLRTNLALRAIVQTENLKIDPETRANLLATTVAAISQDQSSASTEAALAEDPEFESKLQETSLYLTAVEFVMARAQVTVVEEETTT